MPTAFGGEFVGVVEVIEAVSCTKRLPLQKPEYNADAQAGRWSGCFCVF
jgi:hypothetical protein